VQWQHHGPILDQGDLGSCTANALSQALNTGLLRDALERRGIQLLTEREAVGFYAVATSIDPHTGRWPADDTGSSGLAVAKAAKKSALITGYAHAFGLDHTLGALAAGPVIIGVPWLNSMFSPVGGRLVVDESSGVAGGHEVALIGLDVEHQGVTVLNSWGAAWGTGGTAQLAWPDLKLLLAQGGDCTQLVP
jgi:hypothetical protein